MEELVDEHSCAGEVVIFIVDIDFPAASGFAVGVRVEENGKSILATWCAADYARVMADAVPCFEDTLRIRINVTKAFRTMRVYCWKPGFTIVIDG